jgi:hypothetical protein
MKGYTTWLGILLQLREFLMLFMWLIFIAHAKSIPGDELVNHGHFGFLNTNNIRLENEHHLSQLFLACNAIHTPVVAGQELVVMILISHRHK